MTHADLAERVDSARRRFRLPCLSAAVLTGSDPVVEACSGWADRRSGIRVTVSTRFRVGSVSKALTSAALGVLLEDGALELDRSVAAYVPGLTRDWSTITIGQLAAHTSGLPHYRGRDFFNRRHYPTRTDALDKFAGRPLLFPPGDGFHYSSFGWNLLGAAMESASRMRFEDLMATRVFGPLGMSSTAVEVRQAKEQARPYVRLAGLLVPAPSIDPSDAVPSAGFITTTADLVRFGGSVLTDRLLDAHTIDVLWTETVAPDGRPTGYGLGWHRIELCGLRGWGHGGRHVGATALLIVLPESETVIALATNTNAPRGSLTTVAEELITGAG